MAGQDADGCKIDRIVERRGLSDVEADLRRRHESGASLRELESVFNRAVLRRELRDRHVEILHGEVENTYQLLTGDDVRAGARIEAIGRLERAGVDVDELLDDFVSYQTVRTHLRECIGRDTARESTIDRSDGERTIFSMLARSEAVIEQTLDRFRSAGILQTGPLDLTVSARVACQHCGREYSISKLLEEGGCGCDHPAKREE